MITPVYRQVEMHTDYIRN